jgi:hypothetical protein
LPVLDAAFAQQRIEQVDMGLNTSESFAMLLNEQGCAILGSPVSLVLLRNLLKDEGGSHTISWKMAFIYL